MLASTTLRYARRKRDVYSPAITPVKSGQFVTAVERFAPTTADRFGFDRYCSVLVYRFLGPAASGAVSWDVPSPRFSSNAAPSAKSMPLQAEVTTPAASGALLLDTNLIFSSSVNPNWNTPLKPLVLTFWKGPSVPPPVAPAASDAIYLPRLTDVVDLATPYAVLLNNLHATSPWKSWKKLAALLGTSHTQLQRIAGGVVSVPGADVAQRIDELHRFARRIDRLGKGNETVTTRLLTTRRARDNQSANDFLTVHDYRNAFQAVMDAASPRPRMAAVDPVPRRWYDEPSRDLNDDGIEHDE